MQIVIDIPEEEYKRLVYIDIFKLRGYIENGIPLPKGHGRIADIDEMIACIKDVEGEDASWALALIEWAGEKRTIIEADTAESEE